MSDVSVNTCANSPFTLTIGFWLLSFSFSSGWTVIENFWDCYFVGVLKKKALEVISNQKVCLLLPNEEESCGLCWRKSLMIWRWCLSLHGQKLTCKMKEPQTVYREHVKPICHPLKVDLFQCYYVHYASCGSVHRTMIGLHFFTFGFFSLCFLLSRSTVFWFLLYEESLLFRIIKDFGMRLSLGLIYHH